MPNLARLFNFGLLLCLTLCPVLSAADDFAANVRYAKLMETAEGYTIDAEINYQLSPTAKEALHKGVPLAWDVLIKISQPDLFLDNTLYEKKLSYHLQFNALLNQYEVRNPAGQIEMFLSLNAALNFMALVHDSARLDKIRLVTGNRYQLAVKTQFNREFLPVPLRPVAYLDAQWFLSSDWFVWPIQK